MLDLSAAQISLLKDLTKPVVHLREQRSQGRFGLVFGAGIGKDLHFPNWDELVERIAMTGGVDGAGVIQEIKGTDNSLTIRIQRLFEWYKNKKTKRSEISSADEKITIAEWRKILVDCLYEGVADLRVEKVRDVHPYLGAFEKLIKDSEVTINFNFDDTIQIMLQQGADIDGEDGFRRKYKTVSKGAVRARKSYSLLYHPNGFLPRNLLESSDRIVLSEESFADQLLQLNQQKEDFLINHFSMKTCLLIGLSLNDPNLKHILRQSATTNPGHCHYYVCFDEEKKLSNPEKEAIRKANFQVYDLITIFLGREEISDLGILISIEQDALRREAESADINLKYFYYVTGPMGVGKSTCISHLYNISSYDEWTRERLPELAKDRNALSEDESRNVDDWLEGEFYRKNWDLSQVQSGLHMIDRPPLDPLSFTDEKKWSDKASRLLKAIIKDAGERKIVGGHVFLLIGEPKELYSRIVAQNKQSRIETIKQNQEFLKKIYKMAGVTLIDTRYMGVSEVTRFISGIIHLDEYRPADLHAQMRKFATAGDMQGDLFFDDQESDDE